MKVKIGHGIVFWIDAKDYTIFEDFIWEEWGQQIMDCYWMVLK